MTDRANQGFSFLPPAAAGLGHVFARPKWIAAACVVALTAFGWAALGLMVVGKSGFAGAFGALCHGSFVEGEISASSVALVAAMWGAMVLAMMLPTAAPMIVAYAEIADTAARKGERVVTPVVLAAGYTVVWLGFAAAATLAQVALTRAALLDASLSTASGLIAGAIFISAGLYEFSALKHACLTQCQRPFPFFFTNWATTPRGVFRLGLKQGLYCVGCCWAMMLVMFAIGVMNIVWMAALGIVMTVEKVIVGIWFTRVVGVALLAGGVALVAVSVAAHWPGHAI
jgi:predicted metal-binding membrane protein